jgi:hypothetical protein
MSSTGKGRLEAAALGETKIARALKSKGGEEAGLWRCGGGRAGRGEGPLYRSQE